ncbi:MAG: hypothetical protein JRN15_19750 [Nitrososphaerota archaeon]|nr:hypothetical protein [Nitrososphaerota archaeon]
MEVEHKLGEHYLSKTVVLQPETLERLERQKEILKAQHKRLVEKKRELELELFGKKMNQ